MPEPLNTLDVPRLNQKLSDLQSDLNEISNTYQKKITDLNAIQAEKLDIMKEEQAVKADMKIQREKLSQIKENIKSVKILIRAEASGMG